MKRKKNNPLKYIMNTAYNENDHYRKTKCVWKIIFRCLSTLQSILYGLIRVSVWFISKL